MNLLHANDKPGAYPPSYYSATSTGPLATTPLRGAAQADVCIVGGGYTGLSAALHLAERGYDVVVLEAHRVGFGASGRNGGQLGSGQRLEQETLERMMGEGPARALWDLSEEAKALVRGLIARFAMDCDLRPGIIHAAHRARFAADFRHEAAFMAERYNHPMRFLTREEMRETVASPAYHAGLEDTTAGHLHPLNFALGLGRAAQEAGARIHEMSEVTSIDAGPRPRVTTAEGHVVAEHLILACNGYLGDLAPSVAARVMPINNFIIATEPLGPEGARALIANDMAVADTKFVINYFRLSADHRMLFGGRESYGYRFPRDIKTFVRKAMLQIYPQLAETRIDHGWGGTLAITRNRMPHFTRIGPSTLSVSGYSGHGLALATLSGKLAAEAVAGQAERFDLMASIPTPAFPGGAALRWPLLVLAMLWFGFRDRL